MKSAVYILLLIALALLALVFLVNLGLFLLARIYRVPKKTLQFGMAFVFVVSLVSYGFLGNMFKVAQEIDLAQEEQISLQGIDDLEASLLENPANLNSWVLLARSYETMQYFTKSLGAWEKAYKLAPNNQEVILGLTESLARNNSGVYTNRSGALVASAYFMDKSNPDALWQMGLVARQNGDFIGALEAWRSLADKIESEDEVLELTRLIKQLEDIVN